MSSERLASRRELLATALSAAAAALTPWSAHAAASAVPRSTMSPFALMGVASGDPWATGVVLWTRLALDLADAEGWGLGDEAYGVEWVVMDDEAPGRPVIKSGRAVALRSRGYAVHVEVDGLKPQHRYSYRFSAGAHAAEGRTLTAPAPGQHIERLRFAFCSCADYENQRYHAYDAMAGDDPSFVVHLGDYIYEVSTRHRRKPGDPAPRLLEYDHEQPVATLAAYRRRYAEYKADGDGRLRKVHAAAPFINIWDDHEVANDYSGTTPEMRDERQFLARRTAAYRAFFENLPLRLSALPREPKGGRRLYRRFAFGDLLALHMLDTRQYRSPQACPWGSKRGFRLVSDLDCPDVASPRRTMLGNAQMAWLSKGLSASAQRWNVLASGVPFALIDGRVAPVSMARAIGSDGNRPQMSTDSWSGFLAARQQVVDLMARQRAKNPVVISGDVHNFFVNRIFADRSRQGASEAVAAEIVAGAISSFVRDLSQVAATNRDRDGSKGPVVAHEGKSNGYVLCELTRDALEATWVGFSAAHTGPGSPAADRSLKVRIASGDPEPRLL